MSVLRNLEAKLEGLVEGAFSRAFKARVQPVELARKLAKEMGENKAVSLSKVYAPNEYAIFLSPEDREHFAGFEKGLKKELSDYLLEHARRENLTLVTRPVVSFKTDERLGLGEFGIQAQLVRPPGEDSDEGPADGTGHTMVYSPDAEGRRLVAPPAVGRPMLVFAGRRTVLSGNRVIVGRSRECDIQLDDANVSRKHAELRPDGDQWVVADLGSTNGVEVNGRRVDAAILTPGDDVVLGTTHMTFERG